MLSSLASVTETSKDISVPVITALSLFVAPVKLTVGSVVSKVSSLVSEVLLFPALS